MIGLAIFEAGDIVKSDIGMPIKIVKFLAAGGQGEVYVVEYAGKKKALKWYTNAGKTPQNFYENLKRNVDKGSPDAAFLWPEAITEKPKNFSNISGKNSFGYVMDLRPEGYVEMSNILATNSIKMTFTAIVDASLKIISAFRTLHRSGYSYQDLNDGNFFINPTTGDLKIGDNDNVSPNGYNTGIAGKPRYMAPEIVVGQKMPDLHTDEHSLAVILFMLMFRQHPLEGEKWLVPCLNNQNEYALYGSEPVFIADPNDRSNKPDPIVNKGFINIWKCMPQYMKDAYCSAFSKEALHNPQKRLRELDWLKLYVRFRNEIIKCSCGNETFIVNSQTTNCDNCKRPIKIDQVFEYELQKYSTAAQYGARIYRCQVSSCSIDEALQPVAVVVGNKTTGEMGVRNKTSLILEAITPSGKSRQVKPDEVIPFKSGIIIKAFGGTIKLK